MEKYFEGVLNTKNQTVSYNNETFKIVKYFNKALDNDIVLCKRANNNIYIQKIIKRSTQLYNGKIINNKIYSYYHKDTFLLNKEYKNGNCIFKINDYTDYLDIDIKDYINIPDFILEYDIPYNFDNCINELSSIVSLHDRIDLTHLTTLSSNINNAISFENTMYGYRIYVHIADIISYINPGSNIDLQAHKRAVNFKLNNYINFLYPKKIKDLCGFEKNKDVNAITLILNFDREWNIIDNYIIRSTVNVNDNNISNNINNEYYNIISTLTTIGNKLLKNKCSSNVIDTWMDICNHYMSKRINGNGIYLNNNKYSSSGKYIPFTEPFNNYIDNINLRLLMNAINNKPLSININNICTNINKIKKKLWTILENKKIK